MPLSIGVLIPVYNYARFLPDTLNSILLQSRRPDQIVVVDDGSTDQSAEIAAAWGKTNRAPLIVLREPHGGAAAARNAGLARLETDLVAMLDADDLLLPCHLEKLELPFLEQAGLVLCFGDAAVHSLETGERRPSFLSGKRVHSVRWLDIGKEYRLSGECLYRSLLDGGYIPCCSSMFPRALATRLGGWDVAMVRCSDHHFFVRLILLGSVAWYPLPLSEITRHDSNLSHRKHSVSSAEFLQRIILESLRWDSLPPIPPADRQAALEKAAELAEGILYVASRQGLQELRCAARLQSERGFGSIARRPRHWLRACLHRFLPA
jgi:glycosyltransferase involved in cell wall biosynthesis